MTHLQVVQEVRARYPTPLYPEQSGAFLLALCRRLHQVFPDEPAGLRRKDAGTHCTLPDGTNVALDIVMYPTGAAYDALGDADGAATPAWNKIEDLPTDWYVEIDGTPTPPDPPTPPSDPCATLAAQVAALIAQVAALEKTSLRAGDHVSLQANSGHYVCAEPEGRVVADREAAGPWEHYVIRKE